MSYSQTNYLDFLDAVKSYYGSGSDEWVEIAKYGLKADNAVEILKQVPNVDILKNSDGSIRSIAYKNFSTKGNKSTFLAESIDSNVIGGTANVKNSFDLSVPSNTAIGSTGNLEMSSEIGKKVSTGKKVSGALASIGQAVFAVAAGCTLGKTIDSALYNLNPDFWNAHDMETLDPSTWSSITNSGSLGDNLFNILMGVDPDTDETTAYVDQNALAYMAWYLQSKKFFDITMVRSVSNDDVNSTFPEIQELLKSDISASYTNEGAISWKFSDETEIRNFLLKTNTPVYMYSAIINNSSYTDVNVRSCSKDNYYYDSSIEYDLDFSKLDPTTRVKYSYTHNQKTINHYSGGAGPFTENPIVTFLLPTVTVAEYKDDILSKIDWLLTFKGTDKEIGIDGVGTQPDAKTPDFSNVNSVEDALNALKTQYPDLFNDAITNSVPQEDGSVKNYTYVPITLPNTSKANDAEPTTGNQTQNNPKVNPKTSPDTLLDLISGLLNNKLNTPNTPNTGNGSTPSIIPPVGSASALYKIYNPSQAQLDSFGQWLWSSSFVDQLLKVFNNPMESIIGLHKVYASPVIGGQANIKVGYLDSGVPSNFVSNQYTKIDCGTVNLLEYFGNVFDYSPYTNIQLYLPCIGFVNLNVGEVMRSKLNIVYNVDVLTGACLAEVNVIRDGGGGVLYSYSGNCASQYPLSSGSYMGIVSSAIGVAGSVIGTVASGGSLAPLALGSIGAVMNAHTNVQHSGSLSGNSGVMGGKIPYLIITRPQTNMPNNYEHYQGIPSNFYTSLSSCKGFTKVKNVDVRNINAESNELDKIKSLLMDGVII